MDTPAIQQGTHIQYKLSLHGLPMRWVSRIEVWEPPVRFVDVQIKGPYALWHHSHSFERHSEGTLVRDEVRYRLPFGFVGDVAHFFVQRNLKAIFDYRNQAIAKHFEEQNAVENENGAKFAPPEPKV
jgi:ligand-binding SRPBCC domain-containing protein